MKIGAPKETFDGEKRVAMTPQSARGAEEARLRLPDRGRRRRGGALLRRGLCRGRGRRWCPTRPTLWAEADIVAKVRAPDAGGGRAGARRADRHQLRLSGAEPRAPGEPEGQGRHGDRHGHGAADQPRAEDGRAVVDGQHRRLPRGDRGRRELRALLHRPGDGRGQGAAGEGAGDRRRRRRPLGDRHRDLARRDRLRLRRAPRGRRADRVDGGGVRLSRLRRDRRTAPRPAATPRRRARSSARSSSRSSARWRPTSTSSSPPR